MEVYLKDRILTPLIEKKSEIERPEIENSILKIKVILKFIPLRHGYST
jgi:hypothetical protein